MSAWQRRAPLLGIAAVAALTVGVSGSGVGAAYPASVPDRTSGGIVQVQFDSAVYRLQQDLNALGYDAGPEDGLMGSRTRSAIRAYQRDHDLLPTGDPSAALREHVARSLEERSAEGERERAAERRRHVAETQEHLRELGYDVEVTGRMDSSTRTAIRDYQAEAGMTVTGQVSPGLRERLRADAEADADEPRREIVTSIQSELRQSGYDVPVVTGRVDSATEAAIREYQRDKGMSVTGRASTALLASLQADRDSRPSTDRRQVEDVQRALAQRGYAVGPVDGVMGPSTRSALRTYQSDAGLPVTGRISSEVLAELGIEAGTPTGPARVFVSDSFEDGDYTRSPRWQVLAGEFSVEGEALASTVEQRRADDPEAFARSLLQGVLGSSLGVRLPGQPDAAVIARSVDVDNAFRLRTRVEYDGGNGALLNMGVYRGNNAASGYRLVYMGGEREPLRLVASAESGVQPIASVDPGVDLTDGSPHDLEWSRDREGRMTVSIDGNSVIQVSDTTFGDGFDGFSMINGGGRWLISSVRLEASDS